MFLQDISFDENDVAKEVYVVYRIRSKRNRPPEEITSFLGIEPTQSFSKGEKYLGRTFDPSTKEFVEIWRTHPRSVWDLDSKSLQSRSKKVEEHIDYLLKILESHRDRIQSYLEQKEEFFISFYIWWIPWNGHGTYVLSSDILDRMRKLCHFVEFCFISTEDDEARTD